MREPLHPALAAFRDATIGLMKAKDDVSHDEVVISVAAAMVMLTKAGEVDEVMPMVTATALVTLLGMMKGPE